MFSNGLSIELRQLHSIIFIFYTDTARDVTQVVLDLDSVPVWD